ncbi:MAG: endonuclease/exonuclease/phosphatase family protein, partial [Opitutaceae bacterium]|nr:endonuclease/exonuclease/phosphatase family protein [Opitutaceae bacterium]
ASEGLVYPFAYVLESADKVRHLALLSKIPFKRVESGDLQFKYMGKRESVKRGVLEVIFGEDGKTWSLFVVHLKSRYTDLKEDPESEIRRTGEARAVRNYILKRYENPQLDRFMIVGDFNDTRSSRTMKSFLKRGKTEISEAVRCLNAYGQGWTYFYEKEDVYSRVDFLLVSPGMSSQIKAPGIIFNEPEAQKGSDHRLVMVTLKGG